MEEVKELVSDIKKRNFKPIYFLMGEEPYYIDKISDFIEDTVLDEAEKGFNQVVLYGRDVSIDDIISQAKRYPMMSDYQVVIVKEAQSLSRSIDNLLSYAENPQPTTILVINYKYKKLDKRKALYKKIRENGVVFEGKPLYDNQIPEWIGRVLAGQNYSITPKASQMLVEFLGTDLSKISNELDKLRVILPENTQITPEHIEQNIGISKDYNVFELQNAIGSKDVLKATKIVRYFGENPKDHPLVMTTALLFNFFSKLLHYHGLHDKSNRNVASSLKVNPYFVKDYIAAGRNYSMKKTSRAIEILRSYDLKAKGVNSSSASQGDLLKEMLVKIMA